MFGSNEKIDGLTRQLNDALAEKLLLENRLDEAASTIQEFAATEQNYKRQIESYSKQITALKQAHKAEVANVESSVNRKVNTMLASIGVSKFASNQFSVQPDQTDNEIYQKFLSLKGTEQTEFYKLNKDKISRAVLQK